jgi:hypothetical protein
VATLNESVSPEFNFMIRLMKQIFGRFALRRAMCSFLLDSVLKSLSSPTELVTLANTFEAIALG